MRITINLSGRDASAFAATRQQGLLSQMSDSAVARAYLLRGIGRAVELGELTGQLPLSQVEQVLVKRPALARSTAKPRLVAKHIRTLAKAKVGLRKGGSK